MSSSTFRSPDNWGTQSETSSARGNFNYRVMGVGNNLLRDFVSQNITSTSNHSVMDRLMRYQLYWNFYNGRHWKDFNEAFLRFNYVKAFIDKTVFFMVGKEGISFQVRDMEEDAVMNVSTLRETSKGSKSEQFALANNAEKVILRNWNLNKRKIIVQEMLQLGAVYGDGYLVLSWDADKNYVRYNLIDSRFAFIEREKGQNTDDDISKFTIRQPMDKNENDYILFVSEYTVGNIRSYYLKSTIDDSEKFDITNQGNPYDFIPVIHYRNRPNLGSFYSYSDVESILSLNKMYNELNMLIKEVIDYHATPTTVITGANAKALRRGLGRIWSGLPSDAQVFNLTLDSDLGLVMQFTERLKTAMHEFADVPENTLGQLQPISNTSGAALELTFQPLIQQADMKRLMYSDAIKRINSMTLDIMKVRGYGKETSSSFSKLPANFNDRYEVEPVWTYGLPKDRMNDLNMADIELRLGLSTRKEILIRMGKSNVDDLLEEIDAEIERHGRYGAGENEAKEDGDSGSGGDASGGNASGNTPSRQEPPTPPTPPSAPNNGGGEE